MTSNRSTGTPPLLNVHVISTSVSLVTLIIRLLISGAPGEREEKTTINST